MKRQIKLVALSILVTAVVGLWGLVTDSAALREGILRLHVVGASDSVEDQAVKLTVRDAVLASLRDGLRDLTDPKAALEYVARMLPKVEAAANEALAAAGFADTASVSLEEEAFPAREYDSFSLPAGIYKALRVVIGEGEGRNWWCVVFPNLCMAQPEEFAETAAMTGISPELAGTLEGEYEIRFWLLDKLGEIKNYFFDPSE